MSYIFEEMGCFSHATTNTSILHILCMHPHRSCKTKIRNSHKFMPTCRWRRALWTLSYNQTASQMSEQGRVSRAGMWREE
jgi:hypothetical protein